MDFKEALGGAFLCLGGEVVEVVGEAEKEGFFIGPKKAAFVARNVVGEAITNPAQTVAFFGETGGFAGVVKGGESEPVRELFCAVGIAQKRQDAGGSGLTFGYVFEGLGELVEFGLIGWNIKGHFLVWDFGFEAVEIDRDFSEFFDGVRDGLTG